MLNGTVFVTYEGELPSAMMDQLNGSFVAGIDKETPGELKIKCSYHLVQNVIDFCLRFDCVTDAVEQRKLAE